MVGAGEASAATGARVSLRPARPEDEAFLCRVYASTRVEELAGTGWDEGTKEAFLNHQFVAQRDYYRANYENARYDVIVVDGEPAGRLYVARWPEEIRVMDISLLPEQRGAGVGERLMRDLMTEAERSSRRVTIHVEHQNRARSLYERLGFRHVEDRGVYRLMEWRPSPR